MHRVWLVLLFLSCPVVSLADTVTLRADEWYPYNGDPDAERPGYMIELAQTIPTTQSMCQPVRHPDHLGHSRL